MLTELNLVQAQKGDTNMHNAHYQQGVNAAMQVFTGVKHAGFWGDVATDTRQQLFGHPVQAYRQFRKGTLFKPGTGLYHQGLPRSAGAIAATLAMPAMMTLLAAKLNPEAGRGALIGNMAGNVAGSLVGGPLGGAVGRIGGGMLLAPVGQALGNQFDTATAPHSVKDVAEA